MLSGFTVTTIAFQEGGDRGAAVQLQPIVKLVHAAGSANMKDFAISETELRVAQYLVVGHPFQVGLHAVEVVVVERKVDSEFVLVMVNVTVPQLKHKNVTSNLALLIILPRIQPLARQYFQLSTQPSIQQRFQRSSQP